MSITGPWCWDDESAEVIASKQTDGFGHVRSICRVDESMFEDQAEIGQAIAALPDLIELCKRAARRMHKMGDTDERDLIESVLRKAGIGEQS